MYKTGKKGTPMKRTKRMRKAAALSAVLIAVAVLPTGCITAETGGGGLGVTRM
jgi:predicted small secreted protein